ncbi:hypothetical protein KIPB_016880, partial [Kipferlia bialata]|eukprot:g16880.t1
MSCPSPQAGQTPTTPEGPAAMRFVLTPARQSMKQFLDYTQKWQDNQH